MIAPNQNRQRRLDEEIRWFLKELNHPEGFGFAVTQEVRDVAKRILLRMDELEKAKDDWK